MGTVANVLQDWASSSPEKTSLYANQKDLLIRWANEAQLRYADKSECLRDIWQPTITSTGNIALPDNFKREIKDRVKWDANTYLVQIDYPRANLVTSWSNTTHYSIWGGTFYVWGAAAGTPVIPYIKKPAALTVAAIASENFEIPTEYHYNLFLFLDAMFARSKNDIAGSMQLMKMFDDKADETYMDVVRDLDPVPKMRGSWF